MDSTEKNQPEGDAPSSPELAVGIDFGGTSVKMAVCRGAELLAQAEPIPTRRHGTVDALIDAMVEVVQGFQETHPGIVAAGAGLPGFVDFKAGYVHNLTNVPGWHNIPFKHLMEQRLGLPVIAENDANAMAYAEFKFGAARGHDNVVCVTLGTGVGGALILNRQLYRGSSFGAGEIGQMSIDFEGRPGNYGNQGALEKYVGNQQIEEQAIKSYASVGVKREVGQCSPRDIAEAAQLGDDVARQVWGEIGLWLGTALTNITWLLNPDAIVIGGGVAKAGNLLFDPVQKRMQSMLNPVFWERMELVQAHFGSEAGMIGCAALAAEQASHG